jgi:predicted transcriptional regulator
MAEIKATHVIIGGIVFPWEAKAPYVPSGKSVLGALEYNQAEDKIKCHACGGWYQQLSRHLGNTDGISARQYKIEAGLNQDTGLRVPHLRLANRLAAKRKTGLIPHRKKAGCPGKHQRSLNHRAEDQNLRMLCQAQIRQRIMQLALTLGCTPAVKDLIAAGLNPAPVTRSMGMSLSSVMRSLGLMPNTSPVPGRKGGFRQPLPPTLRAQYEGHSAL